MLTRPISSALFLVAASSCGSSGTAPHDMGAAQHDRAAKSDETAAALHARDYEPTASRNKQQCRRGGGAILPGGRGPGAGGIGTVCWTWVVNPTDQHRRLAEEYRKTAAKHRAASDALREAEARACIGIPPDDRDMSPFVHRDDIVSASQLIEEYGIGTTTSADGAPTRYSVGARVIFRAVPGLTAEWLQRIMTCHIARSASLGHVAPSMPDCPLVPNGVETSVVSTGDGFAVDIRSKDPKVAKEILARVRRITSKTAPR